MKQLLKKAKQIAIFILAISLTGCTNDDVELPKVIAGFTYTLNIDTGTVTFINISDNSSTYEWDFGDGTMSTEINPIKTFENGTYTIVLEAENAAGASNTFQDEITILIPEIATLPISFDGENTSYNAETFGGASFAIVDNPDLSGSNTSASKVGAVTNIGAAFEGFYFDLGSPVDLATLQSISMNFWSDTPTTVLIKLEEGSAGPIEATASHGGTGWETIYFTFDSTASYSRLTMFVDGPGTTAGTFYLDDIMQINTADIPCPETNLELPIDFDCNGIAYTDKIVGNVSFEVVDNPELSGINSEASKVGKMTNVGENWENAFFNLDTAIDLSTDQGIKLKLYSDQALPIKLKLEDGTEDPVEADVNHTGSGWEELTFTLLSTASYSDMILFVDGPGTAAGTFYVDDIEQVAGDLGDPCEADTAQSFAASSFNISFETDPGTTETVGETDKLLLGDVGYEYVDNPDFDNAVNSSCKVAKIDKAGNAPYANVQIFTADKFNFTDNAGFKLKIFSPNVGTNVLFKLEDTNDGGINNQVSQLTTIANGWEELTFDFPESDTNKFDRIIIFFGFEQGDALTIHFDDLMLYGTGSGGGGGSNEAVIIDFENNLTGVTTSEFETGGALIANPVSGGINTSANVYEASYNNGNQWWGGIGFVLADGLDQETTVYKAKLYSTVAPTNVLFEVEVDGTNAPVGNVQEITTANEWVEVTFTLANIPSGVNRILIRPDVGNQDGTKPNTGSLYIDDITKVTGGGGGGGGGDCPAPPAGELLSNGDFEAGEVCWQLFSGTSISTTVSNGGSNSAELQGTSGVAVGLKQERFAAGSVQPNTSYTVTFDIISSGDFGVGGVFKAFVFSEGADGGTVGATQHILTDGTTSLATTWETKTFTFTTPGNANQVEGGFSFLCEIVNSTDSATLNIDNVVVKETP